MTPLARSLTVASLTVASACLPLAAAHGAPQAQTTIPDHSFQVRPLIVALEGGPNRRLPFQLELRSGRDAPVRVSATLVALTQDERGTISPRVGSLPAGLDGALAEESLLLPPRGSASLQGWVRADAAGGPLRALGVLITEVLDPAAASANAQGSSLQVRFALRYLVRVDVTVRGIRRSSGAALEVGDGGLIDRDGRALARVRVTNTGLSAETFEVEAELVSAASGRRLGPRFPLILPIKARRSGAARLGARVLPESTVRVEALVPEPVAPGRYTLVLRLLAGRERRRCEFPVEVAEGAFPGQAALLPRAVGAVQVAPPRIELSTGPGRGARMVPLRLTNEGEVPVEVRLAPEDAQGGSSQQLVVRPATLVLAPGAERRAAVLCRGRADPGSRYQWLRVAVRPLDGSLGGARRLPVAILGEDGEQPPPRLGELTLASGPSAAPRLELPVTNPGQRHLALEAELVLRDAYGRVLEEVHAGHGAWVLPGQQHTLVFALGRPLPSGSYRALIRLAHGEAPALELERPWVVGTSPAAPVRTR